MSFGRYLSLPLLSLLLFELGVLIDPLLSRQLWAFCHFPFVAPALSECIKSLSIGGGWDRSCWSSAYVMTHKQIRGNFVRLVTSEVV